MTTMGSVLWVPGGLFPHAHPVPAVGPSSFSWLRCKMNVGLCLWAGNCLLQDDTSAQEHFIFQFKIHFLPQRAWANYCGKVMSSWQLPQSSCSRGCRAWVSSACAAVHHHHHICLWALVPAGPFVPNFSSLLSLKPSAEVHCFLGVAFLSNVF